MWLDRQSGASCLVPRNVQQKNRFPKKAIFIFFNFIYLFFACLSICIFFLLRYNYWSPCALSPCSVRREGTAMRSLRTAMKSSPRAQQRRPNAAKKKAIFSLKYFWSHTRQQEEAAPLRHLLFSQAFLPFLNCFFLRSFFRDGSLFFRRVLLQWRTVLNLCSIKPHWCGPGSKMIITTLNLKKDLYRRK